MAYVLFRHRENGAVHVGEQRSFGATVVAVCHNSGSHEPGDPNVPYVWPMHPERADVTCRACINTLRTLIVTLEEVVACANPDSRSLPPQNDVDPDYGVDPRQMLEQDETPG